MKKFDDTFEGKCEEYLAYLYSLASREYGDCPEIDALVQDTLTIFIGKTSQGEEIKYPKGYLAAVMKNRYNAYLRSKYRDKIIEYPDVLPEIEDASKESEEEESLLSEEYEAVRREIGRLMYIYREVTVRHYVHGQSVDRIAVEMRIPRGTVLSRLSSARAQIKEGLKNMEKYSEFSYAPKTLSIEIWGNSGFSGEPFSLIRSPIEANVLVLAYESPVSVRGLADTMGIPCAYIEPIVEGLVDGELLGKTSRGLVYTRCYMQKYEDAFGDIPAQEALADKYAEKVWNVAWKHLESLTEHELFRQMTEKQKATMILFSIHQSLAKCVVTSKPSSENEPQSPPERQNGGRWLATATVYEYGQRSNNIYEASGPVMVGYRDGNNGKNMCRMFDCQSLFGDAHWAYSKLKYKVSLQTVLRFYASLLPCDVKPDNNMIYDLIPEFEKLRILRRDADGEIVLDIPALPFEEAEIWDTVSMAMTKELYELLNDELMHIWKSRKNKVPKHIDLPEYFAHTSALGAYVNAQLVAIVQKGLMPYHVDIGKMPLIYINYRAQEPEAK